MQELSMNEIETINGGSALILSWSSALGHLGRAFAAGFAVGTFMYGAYQGADYPIGNPMGDQH